MRKGILCFCVCVGVFVCCDRNKNKNEAGEESGGVGKKKGATAMAEEGNFMFLCVRGCVCLL